VRAARRRYGESVSGYQLNRFCTSGLDTLKMGFGLIASGQADAAIGGGVESMSRVAIARTAARRTPIRRSGADIRTSRTACAPT
jgi:acetyl-CoA acetyltransferase